MRKTFLLIFLFSTGFSQFYEDFEDLSDWSISGGGNWSISNSNYCDEGPCANIYFPNEQSGEDAVLSRTISVEEGTILSMYLYGYWDFNVQIILDETIIYENSISGYDLVEYVIPTTGEVNLVINTVFATLGSGYFDELIITQDAYEGPTWYVSPNGSDENDGSVNAPFASIQKGINSAASGDTILVGSGLYYENLFIDGGKVLLSQQGRDVTYIDGSGAGRVLNIIQGATIDGFTIQHGYIDTSNGSGIYLNGVYQNKTVLRNLIIENNHAAGGFSGGGVSLNINNTSSDLEDDEPVVELFNCIIRSNISTNRGGGVYVEATDHLIRFNKCQITNNQATYRGGGIHLRRYFNNLPQIQVDIINCTISYNIALGSASQSIPCGRGIGVMGYLHVNIINSIVYGNYWQVPQGDVTNEETEGYEISLYQIDENVQNTLNINYSNIDGGLGEIYLGYFDGGTIIEGPGIIDTDPDFVNVEIGTNDYNLLSSSPCIDAGNPDIDGDGDDFSIDQDDQDPDGTRLDIGANYFNQSFMATIASEIPFNTNFSNIPISISFNYEPVDFSENLFELSNCTISNFQTDDYFTYTFELVPTNEGLVTAILPEETVQNNDGFYNNELSISFNYDSTPPISTFSTNTSSPTNDANIIATLNFNESIYGNLNDGLILFNCTIDSLDRTNLSYTFEINPVSIGDVIILTNPGLFTDYAGNSNILVDTLQFYYDNLPPELTILNPNISDNYFIGDTIQIEWNVSDDYGIDHIELSYFRDSTQVLIAEEYNGYSQFDWIVPILDPGNLSLLIIATDLVGLSDTAIVDDIEILPTFPIVRILEPSNNDTISIGDRINISWIDSSSLGSINHDLFYDTGNGWNLIESYQDTSIYSINWIVPNEPTDQLKIKLISENLLGNVDSTIIEDIVISVSFPTVVSSYPLEGVIDHWTRSIVYILSQPLDTSTVIFQNINISSVYNNDIEFGLNYIDSTNAIKIEFINQPIAFDTIHVELLDELKNVFGYSLDGNFDEIEGGNYSSKYFTSMVGDYDRDFQITLNDISQFIINWENNDLSRELGPFVGEIPHVYVNPDGNYDYHDMGAFALMWNWYYSNNAMSFANYEDDGLPIIIEAEHDSIYLDIPTDLSAYQVQIQYTPGSFFIGSSDNKDGLFLTHQEQELGVYTIMAQPGQKQLVIPIEIRGRDADISISYKGITDQGELAGQMTKTINIENIPDEFVLYANYPNPFNPTTKIDYGLPEEAYVSLVIFDILGREVVTLVNGLQEPGYRSMTWNGTDAFGRNVGAGMYFYLLQTGDFRKVNKMILLK